MSYLRFTPGEYHAIRRLAQALPLRAMKPSALQYFLVANLPLNCLDLARRVARLDHHRMRLLYEHFRGQNPSAASAGETASFTEEELMVLAASMDFPGSPHRFLRLFQKSLVERLSVPCPALARKLSRLGECQFRLLFEHIKGRREGST